MQGKVASGRKESVREALSPPKTPSEKVALTTAPTKEGADVANVTVSPDEPAKEAETKTLEKQWEEVTQQAREDASAAAAAAQKHSEESVAKAQADVDELKDTAVVTGGQVPTGLGAM